jgi:hypothetical protein
MNRRFPVLSTVSIVLRATGWLTMGLALVLFIYGFSQTAQLDQSIALPNSSFQLSYLVAIIVASLFVGLSGLLTVALGESIGVLFAIEANTRRATEGKNARG